VDFSLTGTKKIGIDILKYPTHNFSSDSTGQLELSQMEWDTYLLSLISPSYDLMGIDPFPVFSLSPNENKTVKIVATPHIGNTILISVKDSSGVPINGASVTLTKTGFEETKETGLATCNTPGQVFWNGLASGTYTLSVSKDGYREETQTFSASAWLNEIITLNP
jgi:hypothetical protein